MTNIRVVTTTYTLLSQLDPWEVVITGISFYRGKYLGTIDCNELQNVSGPYDYAQVYDIGEIAKQAVIIGYLRTT